MVERGFFVKTLIFSYQKIGRFTKRRAHDGREVLTHHLALSQNPEEPSVCFTYYTYVNW